MKSTHGDEVAAYCIDGDWSTNCHTCWWCPGTTGEQWIEIELAEESDISAVTVIARQDCCQLRLGYYELYLGEYSDRSRL